MCLCPPRRLTTNKAMMQGSRNDYLLPSARARCRCARPTPHHAPAIVRALGFRGTQIRIVVSTTKSRSTAINHSSMAPRPNGAWPTTHGPWPHGSIAPWRGGPVAIAQGPWTVFFHCPWPTHGCQVRMRMPTNIRKRSYSGDRPTTEVASQQAQFWRAKSSLQS